MAVKVIFLTTTGAGTWTVPSDWSNTNTVETIGGGGGGRVAAAGGGGGGGGAYSSRSNITTFTPGSTVVNFSVGAGGAAGVTGGDTWFGATTLAASLVGAKGGVGATSATGAAGGLNTSGFPTSGGVRNSGGAGGLGSATVLTGGGGGGAGGPGGTGGVGGAGDATTAGQDSGGGGGSGAGLTTAGGAGGPGGTGTGAGGTNATGGGTGGTAAASSGAGGSATAATGMWTATHLPDAVTPDSSGAATGGGGAGGGSATGTAGAGANYGGGGGGRGTGTGGTSQAGDGIIIITYTTSSVTVTTDVDPVGSSTLAAATTTIRSLGTPAALRTLPTVFRAPENRVRDSNDVGSPHWYLEPGVTVTRNYGTTTDPVGRTIPTSRIQVSADNISAIQYFVNPAGGQATFSFYARSLSGATQEWSWWTGFANVVQVTTSWQRFTLTASYPHIWFHKYNGLAGLNGDIEVYGFQLNLGATAASYAGSNVPTLGNSTGPELGIGPDQPNTYPNTILNLGNDLVTLSNGGKTASITGNANRTLKVKKSFEGLIYWESKIEGKNAQGWSARPGFTAAWAHIDYLAGPRTVSVDPDGKVWLNDVHWAWVQPSGVGDTICFAVDHANRQFWVRVNNNAWVGWTTSTPETRVGGLPLDSGSFPLPIYPAFYLNNTGDSGSLFTAKSDWLYAAPLGYGEIPVSTSATTKALGTPATLRTLPTVLTPRYLGEQRYPHVEQYELEQINIYRANPSAFPQGVGFTASAPVRMSDKLKGAARAHNMWEISNDIFQHDEESGVDIPTQATRFDWFAGRSGTFGVFQNHQWATRDGRTQKQVVDDFMTAYRNSSAHNTNMLDVNHREVGQAYTYIADGGSGTAGEFQGWTDAWWNTQDFGYWSPEVSYLTGVVYQDDNGNGLYDIGEGITGAIVEATDSGSTVRTATTRVGGGYDLALPAGVHGIRVSRNGGSTWTSSTNVTIGSVNVKFDQVYASAIAATAPAFTGTSTLAASRSNVSTTAAQPAGASVLAGSTGKVLGTGISFSGSGAFGAAETGVATLSTAITAATVFNPSVAKIVGTSASLAGGTALAASESIFLGTSTSLAGATALAGSETKVGTTAFNPAGAAAFTAGVTLLAGTNASFAGSGAFASFETGIQGFNALFSGATAFAAQPSTGGSIQATSPTFAGSSTLTPSMAVTAGTSTGLSGAATIGASETKIGVASYTTQGSGSFVSQITAVASLGTALAGASALATSETAIVATSPSFSASGSFAASLPSAANYGIVTWIEFSGTAATAGTAVTFNGAASLAATMVAVPPGISASFGGASAFAVGVTALAQETTLFVGSSTLTASVTKLAGTSASLTGSTAFSPNPTNSGTVAINMPGTSVLAPSLTALSALSTSLAGSGALAPATRAVASTQFSATGSGTFAAPPTGVNATSALLTGASSLVPSLGLLSSVSVSFAGSSAAAVSTSTLQAGGTSPTLNGASALAPKLTAVSGISGLFAGSSALASSASLLVGMFSQMSGSTTMVGSPALLAGTSFAAAGASTWVPSTALFSRTSFTGAGSSTLAASGATLVQGATAPNLAGTSALAPSLSVLAGTSASLTGAGSFGPSQFAGTGVVATTGTLQGSATFGSDVALIRVTNLSLSGAGAFDARQFAGTGIVAFSGVFYSIATLAADVGTGVKGTSASFTGATFFGGTPGTGVLATSANLAGASTLAAALRQTAVTAGLFSGSAIFAPNPFGRLPNTEATDVSFVGFGTFTVPPALRATMSVAFQGSTALAGSLAGRVGLSTAFQGSSALAASLVDLESITAPEGFGVEGIGPGLYDPTIAQGFGTLRSEISLIGTYDPVLKGE